MKPNETKPGEIQKKKEIMQIYFVISKDNFHKDFGVIVNNKQEGFLFISQCSSLRGVTIFRNRLIVHFAKYYLT